VRPCSWQYQYCLKAHSACFESTCQVAQLMQCLGPGSAPIHALRTAVMLSVAPQQPLAVVRALMVFAAGIVISRNFGEALFVS